MCQSPRLGELHIERLDLGQFAILVQRVVGLIVLNNARLYRCAAAAAVGVERVERHSDKYGDQSNDSTSNGEVAEDDSNYG